MRLKFKDIARNSAYVTLAIKNPWCVSASAELGSNRGQFLTSHCMGVKRQPPHSDHLLVDSSPTEICVQARKLSTRDFKIDHDAGLSSEY